MADPEGDPGVHRKGGGSLWTTPSTKKYIDVRPNGSLLSGYRTKKTAATARLIYRILWKEIRSKIDRLDW